jgi:hypothetical protein
MSNSNWSPGIGILVVIFIAWVALAQEPIDPLRRSGEQPGVHWWQVSLAYTPSGQESFGVDRLGQPYTYTRFSQKRELSLAGATSLASWGKLGFAVTEVSSTVAEIRQYSDHEAELPFIKKRTFAYKMFQESRLDAQSRWDPRITVLLGYPWQTEIRASASLLQDPVILMGNVGLQSQKEEPTGWLTVGLGVGFVANSVISLNASTSLAVPLTGVSIPAATLGLKVRYALDSIGKREVNVEITLTLRGDQICLTTEVEAAGQWI